jgi:uncharacterized protein (TIGR02145 family)/uncharacterized repeat protein (TIGR02543 family)
MKNRINEFSGLIILLALAAALFDCEKVPDYCGKGERCNPDYQFCFDSKTYNRCGGSSYNPLTNGCDTVRNTVGTKCFDGTVVKKGTPCGGYTIATNVIPADGGSITRTPESRNYSADQPITLNAIPAKDYTFVKWEGALRSASPDTAITMDGVSAVKPLVAMFKPTDAPGAAARKLITAAFPENGGTVTRAPDGGADPEAGIYSAGAQVRVTANAKNGYKFEGWSGADTSKTASVVVTMNESKTLVAIFTALTYTLTAKANPTEGGAVFVNNTATAGTMPVNAGETVKVTAAAAAGYTFDGWAGGSTSKDSALTITVSGNLTLTAKFKKGGGTTITPPGGGSGATFTDSRDGQKYRTVTIGGVTWMAENINYKTSDSSWCYEDSPDSCAKYGRLYNWNAAMKTCPSGWHLPSRDEVNKLAQSVGGTLGTDSYYDIGWLNAGKKLKSASGWNDRCDNWSDDDYEECGKWVSGNGTDNYGFSALPGGGRTYSGYFDGVGKGSGWWTVTENGDNVYVWFMYYGVDHVFEVDTERSRGYSVRCVQNEGGSATPPVIPTFPVTVSAGAGATGGGSYAEGVKVTITAGTPPTGKQFRNWMTASNNVVLADARSTTTSFTMPTNVVTVMAVFSGTLVDSRDGTTYNTIAINGVTWMAEDLNYETPAYTWEAAMAACPSGWHLPNDTEWYNLIYAVGGIYGDYLAGKVLKSTSSNGTDEIGFSALPGSWWTFRDYEMVSAYVMIMHSDYDFVRGFDGESFKSLKYNVRCVQSD